jgi:DNA-binding CsgD family transcriptional regulator
MSEGTMNKRVLTIREEKSYRLCHHDFSGLSIDEAAKRMGISRKSVLELLKNVERKAPQLPPVLTPAQRAVLCLIEKEMSVTEISDAINMLQPNVSEIVKFLTSRGFIAPPTSTVSYKPRMDGRVKEKF